MVNWASKEGHQWAALNPGADSIHINGKNGPALHLYRGCTYFFMVEQEAPADWPADQPLPHAFVLTNNPVGMLNGAAPQPIPGAFDPVTKGCVCFKVTKTTPRYFFYQCSTGQFEGGLVIVHDE